MTIALPDRAMADKTPIIPMAGLEVDQMFAEQFVEDHALEIRSQGGELETTTGLIAAGQATV